MRVHNYDIHNTAQNSSVQFPPTITTRMPSVGGEGDSHWYASLCEKSRVEFDVSPSVDVQNNTYQERIAYFAAWEVGLHEACQRVLRLVGQVGAACRHIVSRYIAIICSGRAPLSSEPVRRRQLAGGKAHASPAGSLRLRLKQYRTIQRGVCHLSVRLVWRFGSHNLACNGTCWYVAFNCAVVRVVVAWLRN